MIMRNLRAALPLMRSWLAYAAMPAAGIITAPILAHALGPEGRGQLAGILQPMTLASAVAAIGVPSAVTYFVGQRYPKLEVTKLAAKIAIVMTIVVGMVLFVYSGAVAKQLQTDQFLVLVIWTAFVPSAFISIKRGLLQGLRNYKILDMERFLGAGLRLFALLIFWLVGVKSVIAFSAVYMVAGLSASAVLWVGSYKVLSHSPANAAQSPNADVEKAFSSKAFLSYSGLAAFGAIAAAMSARLDQALMPAVVSANELGYYAVAVTVAEIPAIVTAVLTRNILADVAGGVSGRSILRAICLGGVAQVGLIVSIMLALPIVVPIAFGSDFGPAIELVQILLIGGFVGYWASVAASYLGGIGKPGYNSLGPASAALVTVILFTVSWHNLDSVGAAWISVWSQCAGLATAVTLVAIVRAKIVASEKK